MSVNNQSIYKIRAMMMQRIHQTLSKHWPDWWRSLGGMDATEMKSAGAAMTLLHTAPNDLAFGFAYGLYTVRMSRESLSEHDLATSEVALHVMNAIDYHNNELATKHGAFADISEPPFGPDFSEYEVWFHQAPNDFACGTVCGFFCAYDEAVRSGKSAAAVVQPLTPR